MSNQDQKQEPLVYTLKQVAALLQVSQVTVRRAIWDGRLKASRLGGLDFRITPRAVKDWIDSSTDTSFTKKKAR